ncbi:MAG: primosomal protein N' (replication factor Y) - superfamily II helicase [Gammaproteobacteria bacterium]|nr:primosomal protein N' (replication factor Y) - superfamily II helicase [Gammaproteobacteria bacterium]
MPEVASDRFPCEQCGSQLQFQPGTDALVCPYCNHRQSIVSSADQVGERDFLRDLAEAERNAVSDEVTTLSCPGCGARFELDARAQAGACPFCATPAVVDAGRTRRQRPQALLPFKLDESTAREAFSSWLKGLWFAPNGLARLARADRHFDGAYLPYWTFDSIAHVRYRGQRGIEHRVPVRERVEVNGKVEERVTTRIEVRWTPVSGQLRLGFDDEIVAGSRSLPVNRVEALSPWDLHELVDYRAEYLSGFRAELYTVTLEQGFDRMRDNVDGRIRGAVHADIGGDRQRIDQLQTRFSDVRYRLVLLPLWIAAFRFRDKVYRFLVNARTGEVQGDRPYSIWKIALAVGGALLVVGAFGYLSGRF